MAKFVLNELHGITHFLFDWGDTLMVDLPNQTGPMCDWPEVKVVEGALECLKYLNQDAQCHLATNAQDSTEFQIRQALHKAGLSDYIQHIFCCENLGVGKSKPDYFHRIIEKLNSPAKQIMMIGDSLEKDIYPGCKAGIKVIWFNPTKKSVETVNQSFDLLPFKGMEINSLSTLCIGHKA
ncbi:HAD-IA family hydrolase [Paraglaciecola aquimarina]|uniref:HAD-IA family hydrolase n=1 Tax=Paraglaciecola algarum TaxID=3050085 RepID=A0ABS9D3N1_9ALTE|nr:HAD-IA family hydrolase [Paraglaciecola sp. G1-23]MCF2947239.1 HAD-IA family hydrolase [Paraglaciecola sp. G1-23]